MRKLISVIVPVFNEEKNILLFWNEIKNIFPQAPEYDFEVCFVNDGSHDNSAEVISELAKAEKKVKFIDLSRNFGKENALTAGLHSVKGDAALVIDADLQHPIGLIPEFIAKWEEGAEMVIGIRDKNKGEGLVKKIGSNVFYRIMNAIAENKFMTKCTDFRLIDRIVIDEFNRLTEHNRITRGLLDWLGFKKAYIHFQANERTEGAASYNKAKLVKLALSSFVSHSLFPLKFAGYLGVFIILTSGPLGVFIFFEKYIFADPFGYAFSGPAILAVIILFLVGIILSCLGLIALYIGSIQSEAKNRPLYVVRSRML